ncbi:MAG: hypothetical protein N2645_03685 [Clostridia bacterium]|nr:hypothetical protein [Clostridia bacterium]
MDIKENVYIWATKCDCYENGFIISGVPFDNDYGFGFEDRRNYIGNILLINNKRSIKTTTELSILHIQGRGISWYLETECMLDSSFMLTNNILLKHIYSGLVNFKPSEYAKEVFNKYYDDIYPVISSDFIGILIYTGKEFLIEAFSDKQHCDILNKGYSLIFSEFNEEAGIIKLTK